MAGAAVDRNFTPFGAANGLDAKVAVSMLFDSKGFLWVGSREGLYRYDGIESRAFRPEAGSPGSISDTDIRCVFEAKDGTIWIGTNTGGLNRLDGTKGRFTVFRNNSKDPFSLPDDSIYGIAEGPEGGLWVATQRGLGRLDRSTGQFQRFFHQPTDQESLAHDWAFALHLGPTGTLWVGTVGGGLHRWLPERKAFHRYDLAAMTDGPAGRNDVFALHEREDGTLWAGTREGVIVLETAIGKARYFPTFMVDGYDALVTSMAVDKRGRYWLGTMIHGVLIIDPATGIVSRASEQPLGSPGNLPEQPQMSVAINNDQVFVGTWGSGLFRAPLEPSPFRLLNRLTTTEGMRNENISAVFGTDRPGEPWIGSFGGGPQRLDVVSGEVSDDGSDPGRIGLSGVLAMARDTQGTYFAATTEGLFVFDDAGREVSLDDHQVNRVGSLGAGYVSALLPTPEGDLWVGVMGAGLYLRDGVSGLFTEFRHDPENPASLSGDFITALAAEPDGTLWVGTRSNGLNRCRTNPWHCDRFNGRGTAEDGLSHFHVTSLFRDRRGRLWIATAGGGLNRVDIADSGTVRFKRWTRQDGLLDDGIMSVEEDLDESLWLSTRHGLSRLNPTTGQAVNFVAESGLPVSHFNAKASASDEDWLYFGSTDGLLAFPKGSLLEERTPAPVRITRVQVAGRGERLQAADFGAGELNISFGEIVTVQFVSLDYSETAHHHAYRMGPQEPWTDLGAQRQVIFHGLAPGEYFFQARGRDIYGLWGESDTLVLRIEPPFWMTTGFRALLAVALVLIALGLHHLRLARQRRRAEEVQRLSSRREEALEEALGSEAELAVLTPRQKEVLQLIAEGYATREIADLLDLSVKTVEAHRANLMERLDIRDVPGLVRLAIRARLVSPHE